MTLDDLLTPDLDDLLTFRLYLAHVQDPSRPPVAVQDALAACDRLTARLAAQRWIAVRGAEAAGADPETIEHDLTAAREHAREVIRGKIADRQA